MRNLCISFLIIILIFLLPTKVHLSTAYSEPVKSEICIPVSMQVKIDSVVNNSYKYGVYINEIIDLCVDRPIPASIKIAQAILETGGGTNSLSKYSHNHFSIKAGGNWKGRVSYHKDDKYIDGELVHSTFRKYSSLKRSFFDHERLITSSKRYRNLLEIPHSDYKSWAFGLKKAGYATDPNYAFKLIDLIQEHQLYILDQELYETKEIVTLKLKNEIAKSITGY